MYKYGRTYVKDENYIRDHLDDYTDDISKMLEAVKAGKGVAYISLNEPWFNPAYVEVCRLKILFMHKQHYIIGTWISNPNNIKPIIDLKVPKEIMNMVAEESDDMAYCIGANGINVQPLD